MTFEEYCDAHKSEIDSQVKKIYNHSLYIQELSDLQGHWFASYQLSQIFQNGEPSAKK